MKSLIATAVLLASVASASAQVNTQVCRFGPTGYVCKDYVAPVDPEMRFAPFRENDPVARLRDWEENCRTTIYFDQRNFAHAAEVAKRCGMQIQ